MSIEGVQRAMPGAPEREPALQTVEVDFLRHGESTYRERHAPEGERLEDLTDAGKAQIREQAERLVQQIDRDNEVVVLWSSPAWRAQDSLAIIKQVFEENGIDVAHEKEIALMRQIREKDVAYMDHVWHQAQSEGRGDAAVARDPLFQEKNDRCESYPEIQRRALGVYNWIRYIAEHVDTHGKKLHIIGMSHVEFLEPVMEQVFGYDIEKGEGVKKGELLKFTFVHNKDDGEMTISSDFRGRHVEGIEFDPDTRTFVTTHTSE